MKLKVQVWIHFVNQKEQKEKISYFLLLLTRPERGAFWQPVTGSVDEGESIEHAALREAQEETGLSFVAPLRSLSSSFEFESRGETVREYGFGGEVQTEGNRVPAVFLDPHEHTDYRWVPAEQALSMLHHSSNAQMLKTYLKLFSRSLN